MRTSRKAQKSVRRRSRGTRQVGGASDSPEVFGVKGSFTQAEAQAKCASYGANLATFSQQNTFFALGAGWCSRGWVSEAGRVVLPAQRSDPCFGQVFVPNSSGLYSAQCYGVKPAKTAGTDILPFRDIAGIPFWHQKQYTDAVNAGNSVSAAKYQTASTATYQGASTALYQGASAANYQGASKAQYEEDSGSSYTTIVSNQDKTASASKYQEASSATYQGASAANFNKAFGSTIGLTFFTQVTSPKPYTESFVAYGTPVAAPSLYTNTKTSSNNVCLSARAVSSLAGMNGLTYYLYTIGQQLDLKNGVYQVSVNLNRQNNAQMINSAAEITSTSQSKIRLDTSTYYPDARLTATGPPTNVNNTFCLTKDPAGINPNFLEYTDVFTFNFDTSLPVRLPFLEYKLSITTKHKYSGAVVSSTETVTIDNTALDVLSPGYPAASAAKYQGASTATYQAASSATYQGASKAQYEEDSGSSYKTIVSNQDKTASASKYEAASSATYKGASSATYKEASRATYQGASKAQYEEDSGSTASSANFYTAFASTIGLTFFTQNPSANPTNDAAVPYDTAPADITSLSTNGSKVALPIIINKDPKWGSGLTFGYAMGQMLDLARGVYQVSVFLNRGKAAYSLNSAQTYMNSVVGSLRVDNNTYKGDAPMVIDKSLNWGNGNYWSYTDVYTFTFDPTKSFVLPYLEYTANIVIKNTNTNVTTPVVEKLVVTNGSLDILSPNYLTASSSRVETASASAYTAASSAHAVTDSRAQYIEDSAARHIADSKASYQGASSSFFNTASGSTASTAQYEDASTATYNMASGSMFENASMATYAKAFSSKYNLTFFTQDPSANPTNDAAVPYGTAAANITSLSTDGSKLALPIIINKDPTWGNGLTFGYSIGQMLDTKRGVYQVSVYLNRGAATYNLNSPETYMDNIVGSLRVNLIGYNGDGPLVIDKTLNDTKQNYWSYTDVYTFTYDPTQQFVLPYIQYTANIVIKNTDTNVRTPIVETVIVQNGAMDVLSSDFTTASAAVYTSASGSTASSAKFVNDSKATYQDASSAEYTLASGSSYKSILKNEEKKESAANYEAASSAQSIADSKAQYQEDSGSSYKSILTNEEKKESAANYEAASSAQSIADSKAQYQEDSGSSYKSILTNEEKKESAANYEVASGSTVSAANFNNDFSSTYGLTFFTQKPSANPTNDALVPYGVKPADITSLSTNGSNVPLPFSVVIDPTWPPELPGSNFGYSIGQMLDLTRGVYQISIYVDRNYGFNEIHPGILAAFSASGIVTSLLLNHSTYNGDGPFINNNDVYTFVFDPTKKFVLPYIEYTLKFNSTFNRTGLTTPYVEKLIVNNGAINSSSADFPTASASRGLTASTSTYQSASSAVYNMDSGSSYNTASTAQSINDSKAQYENDSGSAYKSIVMNEQQKESASTYEGASSAEYVTASSAEYVTASTSEYVTASTAEYEMASGSMASSAQFEQESGAQHIRDSAATFISASSATHSGPLAVLRLGNNPSLGKFIIPNGTRDQTIITNGFDLKPQSGGGVQRGGALQTVSCGRYVRFKPSAYEGDGYINLSQVMIYNVIGVNVAPNGIAYATSTMQGMANPSIINDGSCTTRDLPNVWQSATNNRDKEYIEIDLGSTQYIYCIRILGMSTCAPGFPQCQKRMFKLRIEILPDGDPSIDPAALSYYKTGQTGVEASVIAQLANNTVDSGLYTLPTTSFDQTIQVNQALGQYIRIRPSLTDGDGFMNLSQVIVYDVLGLNVSVGKNTFATSSITGASPSDIAVDGNMSIRSLPYVWHSNTRDRNKEYFEIDLGSPQTIIAVRIIGRKDCPLPNMCENRMKGLRIEINPDTSIQAMESYKMQKSRPTNQQTQGRHINIRNGSNESNIRVKKIIGYEKVEEPDPSLPNGYVRLWNTKKRTYVYQDAKGQIIPHPIPPSMRMNMGKIRRPPGIPIATRDDEAMMVGGGFRPLSNDVQDFESLAVVYPWTMYFDTQIRKHYYYNVETGIESWEQPYAPRKPLDGEVTYGDFGLKLKWNKYLDDSINTFFYYKPSTGETRWDHPNPPPGPYGLTSISGPYEPSYKMYMDPETGGAFYLNMATQETVWELPISIQGLVRPVGPVRPVTPATKAPKKIRTLKAKPTPKGTRKTVITLKPTTPPAITYGPVEQSTKAPATAATTAATTAPTEAATEAPTPMDESEEFDEKSLWDNADPSKLNEKSLWDNADPSKMNQKSL